MSDPTVYIVDDDPDMRDSLRWLLKTVGLKSVTFPSAVDFLREYAGQRPACLVLDVRMPGDQRSSTCSSNWPRAACRCPSFS